MCRHNSGILIFKQVLWDGHCFTAVSFDVFRKYVPPQYYHLLRIIPSTRRYYIAKEIGAQRRAEWGRKLYQEALEKKLERDVPDSESEPEETGNQRKKKIEKDGRDSKRVSGGQEVEIGKRRKSKRLREKGSEEKEQVEGERGKVLGKNLKRAKGVSVEGGDLTAPAKRLKVEGEERGKKKKGPETGDGSGPLQGMEGGLKKGVVGREKRRQNAGELSGREAEGSDKRRKKKARVDEAEAAAGGRERVQKEGGKSKEHPAREEKETAAREGSEQLENAGGKEKGGSKKEGARNGAGGGAGGDARREKERGGPNRRAEGDRGRKLQLIRSMVAELESDVAGSGFVRIDSKKVLDMAPHQIGGSASEMKAAQNGGGKAAGSDMVLESKHVSVSEGKRPKSDVNGVARPNGVTEPSAKGRKENGVLHQSGLSKETKGGNAVQVSMVSDSDSGDHQAAGLDSEAESGRKSESLSPSEPNSLSEEEVVRPGMKGGTEKERDRETDDAASVPANGVTRQPFSPVKALGQYGFEGRHSQKATCHWLVGCWELCVP
jgi:hypothetical protein